MVGATTYMRDGSVRSIREETERLQLYHHPRKALIALFNLMRNNLIVCKKLFRGSWSKKLSIESINSYVTRITININLTTVLHV